MNADTTGTASVTAAFDQAAARYDTYGPQFAAPIAERLVAQAGLQPGWRVLDAGCGAGAVTIRAARAITPGGNVTGIDLAPQMLQRTATEARHHRLSQLIRLRQADAADPPFAPRSFDAVLASLVLYLLPDPAAALVRWRDLLAPGGVLGFSGAPDRLTCAGRRCSPQWRRTRPASRGSSATPPGCPSPRPCTPPCCATASPMPR